MPRTPDLSQRNQQYTVGKRTTFSVNTVLIKLDSCIYKNKYGPYLSP